MALALTKVSETSTTITIGWTPPVGVAGYVFAAHGQIVSVATARLKDGSPRSNVKFSKASPGPPFEVAAACRGAGGGWSIISGTYDASQPGVVYPSTSRYPSEVFS